MSDDLSIGISPRALAGALGSACAASVVAGASSHLIFDGVFLHPPASTILVTAVVAIVAGYLRVRSLLDRAGPGRLVCWDAWGVTERGPDGVRTAIPWSEARWARSTASSQVTRVVGRKRLGASHSRDLRGHVTRYRWRRRVVRFEHDIVQLVGPAGETITAGAGSLPAWAAGCSVGDASQLADLVRVCAERATRVDELSLDPRAATQPMAPPYTEPQHVGLALVGAACALVLTERPLAIAGVAAAAGLAYVVAARDRWRRRRELRDLARLVDQARPCTLVRAGSGVGLATIEAEGGERERVRVGEGHADARLADRDGEEVLVSPRPASMPSGGYRSGEQPADLAVILETGPAAYERRRIERLLTLELAAFSLAAAGSLSLSALAATGHLT